MVEPLQMMMHLPIFQVRFPANALSTFGDFVPIVNFDLLGETKIYNNFLKQISSPYFTVK